MKLVTTSVVRGSHQGESHGGVYLIDLERARSVRRSTGTRPNIDWQGRGWDRGLRGIAFDGDVVYIAASDELFAYTPDFRPLGSWRNPYLRHCHEIAVWERTPVPGFDRLRHSPRLRPRPQGVLTGRCTSRRTSSDFKGTALRPAQGRRPADAQQAAPQQRALHAGRHVRHGPQDRRDAALQRPRSADGGRAAAGHAQRAAIPRRRAVQRHRSQRCCAMRAAARAARTARCSVPRYPTDTAAASRAGPERASRARVSRAGSRVLSDSRRGGRLVAVDRVASTTSRRNERVLSVNLTMDVRNAIHGLEVWPYDYDDPAIPALRTLPGSSAMMSASSSCQGPRCFS